MTYLLVVVAIAAIGAALAFYFQFAALSAQDAQRRAEAEEARASAEKARKELETFRDEFTRKKAEASDLRARLSDVRKRTHRQREEEKRQKVDGAIALENELESAQRMAQEEAERADILARDLKGALEEYGAAKKQIANLETALKNAQAATARAAAAASVPAAAAVGASAPASGQDDALKTRVESLETQLRDTKRKLAAGEDELRKARTKASTATRLQLLTKGELDLFREKLVWSEKRVVELEKLAFDNKLELPVREPAPQPAAPQPAPGMLARESANTGGEGVVAEAADYEPEATAAAGAPEVEQADLQETAQPAEKKTAESEDRVATASPEAPTAGETATVAEAPAEEEATAKKEPAAGTEDTPQAQASGGVVIRRTKPEGDTAKA